MGSPIHLALWTFRRCARCRALLPMLRSITMVTTILATTIRKYDPVTHTYAPIEDVTLESTTIAGANVLKASYEVVDGGALDADGIVNGRISDPAGPAIVSTASVVTPIPGVSPIAQAAAAPSLDAPRTGAEQLTATGVHILAISAVGALMAAVALRIYCYPTTRNSKK